MYVTASIKSKLAAAPVKLTNGLKNLSMSLKVTNAHNDIMIAQTMRKPRRLHSG